MDEDLCLDMEKYEGKSELVVNEQKEGEFKELMNGREKFAVSAEKNMKKNVNYWSTNGGNEDICCIY